MSVNYANTLKDLRLTDVITKLDAQGGFATLEICTAAYAAVLAVITLQKPSFTEASQVMTMAGVPLSATAGATGTAAVARIKDSAGTVWISGLTVGTSGTDLVLNSASITSGQTITITAAAITAG